MPGRAEARLLELKKRRIGNIGFEQQCSALQLHRGPPHNRQGVVPSEHRVSGHQVTNDRRHERRARGHRKMAKIALVSTFLQYKKDALSNSQRRGLLESAIATVAGRGASHVVFPGWTLAYSSADAAQHEAPADITFLAGLSKAHGISLVVELAVLQRRKASEFKPPPDGLGIIAIEKGTVLPWRGRQCLATAGSRPEAHDQLAEEVFSGKRALTLDGVRFLVLVCGENNLLRNVQADRNRVELRRSTKPEWNLDALRAMDHDVVINPAHTEMGNQGKLHRRWEWLSVPTNSGCRYCLHTTNVIGRSPGRALYAFRNGRRVKPSIVSLKGDWRSPMIDVR